MLARTLVILLVAVLCPMRTAAFELSVVSPARGGEIRMVVCDAEIPFDLTATGLLRFDQDGKLVPSLADTWSCNVKSTIWSFRLRPDIRFADGVSITESHVMLSLKSSRTRAVLPIPVKKIRANRSRSSANVAPSSSEAMRATAGNGFDDSQPSHASDSETTVVIELQRRDPNFDRRLALPAAAIALAGFDATGPFRVARRETAQVMFSPNPYSDIPVRAETIVLFTVADAARGVQLVEAGAADVAPVGDEDFARLSSDALRRQRLVSGKSPRIFALTSRQLPRSALVLLRRAIDRATIARLLMNGRAVSIGPEFRMLTTAERSSLSANLRLAVRIARASNHRVLPRIAYDLRRSGLSCEIAGMDRAQVVLVEYSEGELPPDAVPILSMTPCWITGPRIKYFAPPRDGNPGLFAAEAVAP